MAQGPANGAELPGDFWDEYQAKIGLWIYFARAPLQARGAHVEGASRSSPVQCRKNMHFYFAFCICLFFGVTSAILSTLLVALFWAPIVSRELPCVVFRTFSDVPCKRSVWIKCAVFYNFVRSALPQSLHACADGTDLCIF